MSTEMKPVFEKTPSMRQVRTHYCPGCGHGIAHRLIAEVVDELDIRDRIVGIAPVGCAVLAYNYLDLDMIEVAHGRAPAVATGMKRVSRDKVIFSYQGDGDLASIGAGEILHAAHRGEQITVIFINNAVYGMTGGQMAPTTLTDQITATTPEGRGKHQEGYPLRVSEVLAQIRGAAYIERRALFSGAEIRKTKMAIKRAFQMQMDNEPGLSLIEILSPCPTYWRMSAAKSMNWIKDVMTQDYPLGKIRG